MFTLPVKFTHNYKLCLDVDYTFPTFRKLSVIAKLVYAQQLDYNLMLKLTKLKGVAPSAKLVAMAIEEANKS